MRTYASRQQGLVQLGARVHDRALSATTLRNGESTEASVKPVHPPQALLLALSSEMNVACVSEFRGKAPGARVGIAFCDPLADPLALCTGAPPMNRGNVLVHRLTKDLQSKTDVEDHSSTRVQKPKPNVG